MSNPKLLPPAPAACAQSCTEKQPTQKAAANTEIATELRHEMNLDLFSENFVILKHSIFRGNLDPEKQLCSRIIYAQVRQYAPST
jgi:hypothetical protein